MTFQESFRIGLDQAKKNLKPAVVIWIFGLSLAIFCSYNETVRNVVESLVDIRKANDPWFTIVVFATAGAIVPSVIERFTLEPEKRDSWRAVGVKAILWALNGIATKHLFKFMDNWIGEERTPAKVTGKVLFDQLVYAAFVTTPIIVLVYLWAGKDLSFAKTRKALQKKRYRFHYLETYMANLAVWFVAAFIMFSAPAGASIIFAMILLTFWGVVLGTMARN